MAMTRDVLVGLFSAGTGIFNVTNNGRSTKGRILSRCHVSV